MKKLKRIRMGEPVRVRIESAMRRRIEQHASAMSAAVGQQLGVSAAIRDLLARALDGDGAGVASASGFREGFLRGYGDAQRKILDGARSITEDRK
jgi:hypothetical protein